MTKFIGKTMTLEFGGIPLPCLQSVEISEDVEEIQYQCPESDTALTLTGAKNTTMTINVLLDKGSTGSTTLAAIAVGQIGTILFRPEGIGAGKIRFDCSSSTVTSRQTSFGINSITAVTINLRLDNLTYSAP
jgi:hypothetical protein